MTPQEALQIIDQAVADYKGTRNDHQKLVVAIQTIDGLINPAPAAEAPPKPNRAQRRHKKK